MQACQAQYGHAGRLHNQHHTVKPQALKSTSRGHPATSACRTCCCCGCCNGCRTGGSAQQLLLESVAGCPMCSVRTKLQAGRDAHGHELLEQQLARVRHEHLQDSQQRHRDTTTTTAAWSRSRLQFGINTPTASSLLASGFPSKREAIQHNKLALTGGCWEKPHRLWHQVSRQAHEWHRSLTAVL